MNYRFNHIHLICTDMKGMAQFFTKTLGATFVGSRNFGGTEGVVLDLHGTAIYIRPIRESDHIPAGCSHVIPGYHHIGLEVNNLEAAYSELERQGFTFTLPPKNSASGSSKVAFFKGPEGIMVELVQKLL